MCWVMSSIVHDDGAAAAAIAIPAGQQVQITADLSNAQDMNPGLCIPGPNSGQ